MVQKPPFDSLALLEQEKYDRLWLSVPEYRRDSPADFLTPLFLQHFQQDLKPNQSVIDFGCGPGRSASHLLEARLQVALVDISENCLDPDIFLRTIGPQPQIPFFHSCLWDLPKEVPSADWVICFDVMEHIPEAKVDDTLKQIAAHMRQGGLFCIALTEDVFGQTIGQKLHLTVRPKSWWRASLERHFSLSKEFESDESYLVIAVRASYTETT